MFLIRDPSTPLGYTQRPGASLPRTREENYMPWALSPGGEVVYALTADRKQGTPGLRPYDRAVSQKRRGEAQSALGLIALDNPQMSLPALRKVSAAIKSFLLNAYLTAEGKLVDDYAAGIGKYAYGMAYKSFGRFSDDTPVGPQANKGMWQDALGALDSAGPIPALLNIHDNVPAKLFGKYAGRPLKEKYETWADKFRASRKGELFHDDIKDPSAPGRGRVPTDKSSYGMSKTGGMMPKGQEPPSFANKVQAHNRGVDMFARSAPQYSPLDTDLGKGASVEMRTKFSSLSYYRDLDTRNELFGAGPSGTTGTLLASAMTFGDLAGEELKQYCFAIIGYLVGGGCHALHESLTVMGYHSELEYNSSSMLGYSGDGPGRNARGGSYPILPASFTSSGLFADWQTKYYDVAVLGGTHWLLDA